MTAKYHFNPETGKPGVCKATIKECRFKLSEDQHFSTIEEASKGYENYIKGSVQKFPKLAKPKKFYHITSLRNIDGIRSSGLVPKIGDRSINLEEKERVYLFDSKQSAEDALGSWLGEAYDEDERLVLLEIDSKDFKALPTFENDGLNSFEWSTDETISPYQISILSDDLDEVVSFEDLTEEAIPLKNVEEDYKMSHQPSPNGAFSYKIDEFFPDFYQHPEWYYTGDDRSDQETLKVLKKIKNNPEAEVTIYRGVPSFVKDFEKGNWVSLSKTYAGDEGSKSGGFHIISKVVKAKELRNDGDSMNEFGWFPDNIEEPVGY